MARDEYKLCGVKWYGEGVFEREVCRGAELSAAYLYPLRRGSLIYNRLFAWKASFALVSDSLEGQYVSNEFPQFAVDDSQADPEFVLRCCLSESFIAAVKKASEGSAAVSRNRFKEATFLDFEIALPPLAQQRLIVERWAREQQKAKHAEQSAAQVEAQAQADFLAALGLSSVSAIQKRRAFAVRWSDMARWGGESNRLAKTGGSASSANYPLAQGTEFLVSVSHGCSASPSDKPTGLEVLKISAVTRGKLDVSEKKFAPDDAKLRKQFALQKNDVLLCRTNGTLGYVGRAALVEDDWPDLIFPDKVIRVRLKDNIIPAFFWHVLGTPFLRAQIESFARTAVGNYAIGGKDIWKLQVPLPQPERQVELVDALNKALAHAATLRTKAADLQRQAKVQTEAALLGG